MNVKKSNFLKIVVNVGMFVMIIFMVGCTNIPATGQVNESEYPETNKENKSIVDLDVIFEDDILYNDEFKETFIQEIQNVNDGIDLVNNIKVRRWSNTIYAVSLQIIFNEEISLEERDSIMEGIIEHFESLDYVKNAQIPPKEYPTIQ